MDRGSDIFITVPDDTLGERLDVVVAQLCPQFSRSQLQKWIKSGDILVNNAPAKTRDKLHGGEEIIISPVLSEQTHDKPEAIDLNIVYEDDDMLVINKPAGLVVHPGAGNLTGTLVNGHAARYEPEGHSPTYRSDFQLQDEQPDRLVY